MATDNSDLVAYFSNYGRTTVDLGAPGVDILSCRRGGGYQLMSGTSMATPHVAGACGLLLSHNPSLTVEQMESALLRTVDVPAMPLTCVSSGRMNIARALLQVGASWVTVNPSAGTNIPPGSAVNVTVGFDADAMAAGTYSGQVVVASNDRNTPMTNVPVTMVILRDNLRIAPTNEFVSSGEEGGPFTPATRVYTLTNAGASILNWTAASTTAWLRVAPTSGALAAGASVSATATITSVANGLSVGSYGGIITFSNRSSGAVQWRRVSLRVVPQVIYTFALDTNPGWTTEGQWAFGQPLGLGGDPTAGYTGLNVYGYNLAGAYSNLMPVYRLTTTALDCSGYTNINLSFRRWLGVENYFCDHADIEVSTNGVTWTTVWSHAGGSFQDTQWTLVSYPLPGFASESPTVYIRWGMGPTDGSVVYSGWNIDDVVITGSRIAVPPMITVTPLGLDYGTIPVRTSSNLAFVVQNVGGGILSGSGSVGGVPFAVVAGSPYSLAAGQGTSVVVRYSPVAAGTNTDNMTFTGGGGTVRPVIGRASSGGPVEVIVDNADGPGRVQIVGTWTPSTGNPGYWATNYLHDGNTNKGTKTVTFRPNLTQAGDYEVSVWYVTGTNRATNVPVDVVYSGGTRTVRINERTKGSQWVVLGTNTFAAGTNGYVKIRTDGTTNGYVIADAVKFKPAGVLPVPVILTSTNAVTVPEGSTATFQVKLNTAPISPTTVTVSRVSGGDTNLTVQSGGSLVFNASNWKTNRTVTLRATEDADRINGSAIIRCSAPGLVNKDVRATEQDNDHQPGAGVAW